MAIAGTVAVVSGGASLPDAVTNGVTARPIGWVGNYEQGEGAGGPLPSRRLAGNCLPALVHDASFAASDLLLRGTSILPGDRRPASGSGPADPRSPAPQPEPRRGARRGSGHEAA